MGKCFSVIVRYGDSNNPSELMGPAFDDPSNICSIHIFPELSLFVGNDENDMDVVGWQVKKMVREIRRHLQKDIPSKDPELLEER